MSNVEIRINNTGDAVWWLYRNNNEWKSYCGCENFDEEVYLFGNRDYIQSKEPEWLTRIKDIMSEIDSEFDKDEIMESYSLSNEQYMSLKKIYDEARTFEDTFYKGLFIIYPEETFKTGTIRGYSQSEWQEYIIKGNVDIEQLENMFFGKISEVSVIEKDDTFYDIITHNELWKAEREGKLKEMLRNRYDLSEDDEITIYKADGYKRVLDWEEVE